MNAPIEPMDPEPEPTRDSAAPVRTGPLRNGNPRGNPNLAPRCGAKARSGLPCRAPAMKNGRCQMHGGKSTGPRTAEGLARMAAAHTTHGRFAACGAVARAEQRHVRTRIARIRLFTEAMRLQPFLPPGMAALLAHGPAALRAPKHLSQVAFEAAVTSSPWTVREGVGGGQIGGTAVAVNWRDAERAAVQAEAAERLPWQAAIAMAREAKRAARAGGPRLSPVQREIALRAAGLRGGGHSGWRRIESMDREGGGGS